MQNFEQQMPAADYALEARGISKSFGGFFAVKDVDLKIRRGSVHALIGPNGAGKTTCFNMLTKALQPTSGKIFLEGKDISRLPTSDVARLGLGTLVPDLGHVPAPDLPRKCPCGAAIEIWQILPFLALSRCAFRSQ